MNFKNKINGLKSLLFFDNKYQLILLRIFYKKRPLNIYYKKGKEILIDHNAGDANGTREAITSQMYKQFFPFLELPSEISVLDLGANSGGFPLLLELNKYKIKKLVCVEINPQTFTRLRFNIERNIDCDFTGLNVAVTGTSKEYKLFLGKGSTSDSVYKASNIGKAYRINGKTLDEIFAATYEKKIVDICKMDVEGAEDEIFNTPHYNCLKYFRYLIIEFHTIENINNLKKTLKKFNFIDVARDPEKDVYLFKNKGID